MAARKNKNPANEKTAVRLFFDGRKYSDDVTVIVNGKSYIIKRGIEVMVPFSVKLALEDAARQEQEAQKYIDDMQG